MTARVGLVPPLHRRFDEVELLEQIQNRYRRFEKVLGRQVEALQKSPAFLSLARQYYDEGYKDWHILSLLLSSSSSPFRRFRANYTGHGRPTRATDRRTRSRER